MGAPGAVLDAGAVRESERRRVVELAGELDGAAIEGKELERLETGSALIQVRALLSAKSSDNTGAHQAPRARQGGPQGRG